MSLQLSRLRHLRLERGLNKASIFPYRTSLYRWSVSNRETHLSVIRWHPEEYLLTKPTNRDELIQANLVKYVVYKKCC